MHVCARGTEYVEMTVTGDGPGIDTDLLPQLFERFVRPANGIHAMREASGWFCRLLLPQSRRTATPSPVDQTQRQRSS
jgi:hypothetical protein